MSFISVLKSITSVFTKVNDIVAPLEPTIAAIPGWGSAFNLIFNSVMTVEQLFASIPNQTGAQKKQVAETVINASVPGFDPTVLSTVIDEIVTAMNQLQATQAKLATIPPAVK